MGMRSAVRRALGRAGNEEGEEAAESEGGTASFVVSHNTNIESQEVSADGDGGTARGE